MENTDTRNSRLYEEYKTFLEAEEKSKNTIKTYLGELKNFALWLEETNGREIPLDEVFAGDIQQYKEYLLSRRKSPNTVNKKIEALRNFYESFLKKYGVVNVKKVKQQGSTVKWLSRSEKNALLRAVNKEGLFKNPNIAFRNRAIIYTFLLTGLRLNELLNLRWDDWKNGYIEVIGKGHKYRRIEINSELKKLLTELKEKFPESEYIFCTLQGKKLTAVAIQDIFKRINQELDFKITPHMLRHTFAHDLIEKGVRIDLVADILGHSRLDVTRIYTKPSDEEIRKALESLELGG